ncbi:hypothetical protein ACO2Q3_14685 [Caulobacter sp. KR2-114]|uniref:hypothetical protein n=1 Tax=Caulobacter sp. KR2-114 TaxID=3400912 RepID=UPI003C0703B8
MRTSAATTDDFAPFAAAPQGGHSNAADRLSRARRTVEGRFLEAGEVLGRAVEGLSALVGALEQLAAAVDVGTVAQTTAELNAAADGLMRLPERRARRREGIGRMSGAGRRLTGGIEDMRRNLAYLRAYAINVKITAGGITEAGREFGDFAQEICDCIEAGRGQLDAFEAELRALAGAFYAAAAQEQALAEHCAGLLPALPNGLRHSAEAMAAQRHRIGQAAVGVSHLARTVQRKVGQALGALQIGDITRQRLEHVDEGLAMLAQAQGLDEDQFRRMSAYVHGLLAAQLRAASADFHADVGRIGKAMAGLATDAREILRLREMAFGDDGRGGGFLSQLESQVGQAVTLVDDMSRADQQARGLGGEAAEAATRLGQRIVGLRDMKTDVQQMALNTTLKCSRIGESGKPLAVIAVELRLHAGHMEESVQAALGGLEGLTEGASELSGERDAQMEGGVVADIGASLAGAADRLRQAGEAVETDLEQLARQGDAVVEALNAAVARMDFQREIGAAIDAAAEAFDRRADGLIHVEDLEAPLGDLLERLARRYTMAQERETHASFTAGLTFATVDLAAPAAETDEDVLF